MACRLPMALFSGILRNADPLETGISRHSMGSAYPVSPGEEEKQKPVGNPFFAGEHCRADFQGYVNGAP